MTVIRKTYVFTLVRCVGSGLGRSREGGNRGLPSQALYKGILLRCLTLSVHPWIAAFAKHAERMTVLSMWSDSFTSEAMTVLYRNDGSMSGPHNPR